MDLAGGGTSPYDPFEPYEIQLTYTGNIQQWTVPATGIYKIELYGAQGQTCNNVAGGKGSYVKSYHELKKNDIYYVCIGQQQSGQTSSDTNKGPKSLPGGYNGGGSGYLSWSNNYSFRAFGGGGGATHVSKVNDILKNITVLSDILCVAAGGGGSGSTNGGTVAAIAQELSNSTVGQGSSIGSGTNNGAGGGGLYGGQARYSGVSKYADCKNFVGSLTVASRSGSGLAHIERVM